MSLPRSSKVSPAVSYDSHHFNICFLLSIITRFPRMKMPYLGFFFLIRYPCEPYEHRIIFSGHPLPGPTLWWPSSHPTPPQYSQFVRVAGATIPSISSLLYTEVIFLSFEFFIKAAQLSPRHHWQISPNSLGTSLNTRNSPPIPPIHIPFQHFLLNITILVLMFSDTLVIIMHSKSQEVCNLGPLSQ